MSLHRSILFVAVLSVAAVPCSALAEEGQPELENAASESEVETPQFRMTYPVRDSASGRAKSEVSASPMVVVSTGPEVEGACSVKVWPEAESRTG